MCKKLICGLLAALQFLSLILPVCAEETQEEAAVYPIHNKEDFLEFAEKCRLDSFSFDLTVSLEADLDLGGVEFAGIPVFCGTFLGNGHSIRGLVLKNSGSYRGLFRYLTKSALVENLHIEGLILPEGSAARIGGLAGSNAGTVRSCSFTGTVSGNEHIGGLVGINAVSGMIENCPVEGFVSGNHFVGGIAGSNSGVIRNCKNDAKVNTTAKQNSVQLSDITLESLTASEASNTVTDIGGIVGHSTGVIRSCVNRGDVGYRHMGYNIGGIAGTQSGYLADCRNYAPVMGRKEVGGLVGQMEPTTLIEYEEDVLQILERQLNAMGTVVSDTAANLQGGAQGMYAQVDALMNAVNDAEDALQSLVPEGEELPDPDTVQAAKNALSNSMTDMTDTLRGMSAVTESMVGTLSNNLYVMQNQMNAMRATLGNAEETLGGSITDVSDKDTEADLTGKVEKCVNYGTVLADLNAGGIAGAMAVENDLDHREDISITGSNSLNFSSELRCVIRDCRNAAAVTAGKQNAGGIVGWQSVGLVKNSYNHGMLDAASADYVGGIAGQSEGYIRTSGARCEISGNSYVGGIAGSATIVTDCLSAVRLQGEKEWIGTVLGARKDGYREEEKPVSGNRCLSVGRDIGAIDGISYSTLAEPIALEELLALETLPELFRNVTVTFRYENGGESRFSLVPGDAFPEEKIPSLREKAGYIAQWAGLEEADLEQVLFDLTFEAEYTPYESVLSSGGEKPLILVQGGFTSASVLEIGDCTDAVPLEKGQTLIKAKTFTVTGAQYLTKLRFCIYDWDVQRQTLLIRAQDGTWYQPEVHPDGSYLVAELREGDNAVAQIQEEAPSWYWLAAGGILLAVVLAFVIRKRKRR